MSRFERLDSYLQREELAAVWFARPNSFAWLTGGNNLVSRSAAVGEAAAGYDGEELIVVTNNIEAPRLREEELPETARIETFDWYEGSLAGAVADVSSRPAAADFDVPGFDDVDASPLRQPLTESDVAAVRELSADTAEAVESVSRELVAGDTEQAVAARLQSELQRRGCDAPVVLVGGSGRARQFRHLPPSESELGEYVLVSVVARRGGMHVSTTRTVAFDPPSWLAERHEAAMRVETAALAASQRIGRRGGSAGEVFEAVQAAYADEGYDGEWQAHHQGGAAGFDGREWVATPDLDVTVRLPMPFAWNPTVQGAKSEGTVLVTADHSEPLTVTGDWPTETVTGPDGQFELPRNAILER